MVALDTSAPHRSMWHWPRWAPRTAGRLEGLDVARALAVLGMVAAHVGNDGSRMSPEPGWEWLWIADGRASAMFAIFMGISVSLMHLGRAGKDNPSRMGTAHTSIRVAVRGALLIGMGYVLATWGTPVDVILANLGVMLILSIGALRWRIRWLIVAALICFLAGRWARGYVQFDEPVLEKLTSIHYPAVAWMGYVLAGMALGRLALDSRRVHVWLMALGAPLAVAAYTSGPWIFGAPYLPGGAQWDPNKGSVAAHSYSPFELIGNLGVTMVVLGACLWVVPWLRQGVWPLIAMGSTALSSYVAHLVVIWWNGETMVWSPSNSDMLLLCAGLVVGATVWRAVARQGPLEWALTWLSAQTANLALRKHLRRS